MNIKLISTLAGGLLMGASMLAHAGGWGAGTHGNPEYRHHGGGWSPAERHWEVYRHHRGHHYWHHPGCHPHAFVDPHGRSPLHISVEAVAGPRSRW